MFQKGLLSEKVVLITGGGTGLGRAAADEIVRLGGKVALVGRRKEILDTAVCELGPDSALSLRCDVRFTDEVDAAIDAAMARFGQVNALINNAAGNFVCPTERLTPNAFKLIIETVLMGTVHFSLEMGKRWIKSKVRGTNICISTNYASTGSAFVVPSACAKAGVENLVRSLAAEWGHHGIRTVGISPGPFPTKGAMSQLRIYEDLIPGTDIPTFITERIPLQRLGRVEELASLAVYLLSPLAEYINGEIIRIDGGEVPNLAGEFSFMHCVSSSQWEGEYGRLKRGAARTHEAPASRAQSARSSSQSQESTASGCATQSTQQPTRKGEEV
jgi:NAD(P)-dependent dehydrogenase (short-subunit alcohol dehydrogenase family)